MKKIHQIKRKFILFSFLLISFFARYSIYGNSLVNKDSLRIEVLLNEQMLLQDSILIDFNASIEVTASQLVLLSSANRFYLLGWGGLESSGQVLSDSITSFAYSPDGYLLTVSRKSLCYLDSTGKLETLRYLPNESLGIASGENVIYFFDLKANKEKYPLYVMTKGGVLAEIFDVPDPITAVVEIDKTILFSSLNTLFAFDPKTKTLEAMATIEKENIISIAINPESNTIYFASKDAVYALKEHGITVITDKFGGILKYFNQSLMVFDASKKFLIRIVNFEK